ncbi:glucan-binding YG repeat protein [Clostridium beijerinckii]|uniref:cell wall-binding protein n=1 Tax=Clostridium beijerinckii TaxID=1520 RepID=UPI00156DFCCE|nr:cell wall-binding protein [Clostridium beijerinckii]NRT32443.1 glucan-binding YG repeat protein [Clostridium beijerinckii]NRT48129.1 glucan-binding YG repeat protein [Clostridium beijerinckii]NRZ23574.1 glucan-binding YG repeat protein [Clostridium beijerinckii]
MAQQYEIYIGDYNNTNVLKLPILPKELPSLSAGIQNEEFSTYWDGNYNFIEKTGLLSFTLESWIPLKASKYNFCKSNVNAQQVIDLVNNSLKNTEPIRILINTPNGYYVNDTFSIEKWEYKANRRGDFDYSLDVKEWRDYNTIITATPTTGWNQDDTGWWYVYNDSGDYYKGCWQLIDNEWYSFQPTGYILQSSWLQDSSYWYYLKSDGKMARNEWMQYKEKWYYLGADGAMWFGATATIDGAEYTFGDDGALIE